MSYSGKTFMYTAMWIARLPEGMWFSTEDNKITFQRGSYSIEEARVNISKAFELTEPWTKHFREDLKWWEYRNKTNNGILMELFGDREGPAACEKVEYYEEEDVRVPTSYRTERLRVKKVKWVCPDD